MLQAAVCDGCTLDAFTLGKDYLGPAEVDVSRREVVQALVIADVVIVLDEGINLPFKIAGQVAVFEQNAVLQGLVPALDLAWVCGWQGAPRTWSIALSASHSASSPAM